MSGLSIVLPIAAALFGLVALLDPVVGGVGATICGMGAALAAWRASVQTEARLRAAIEQEGEKGRAFAVGYDLFMR